MFGFQAKTRVFGITGTCFARNAGKHISGVKLDAGLGGKDLHASVGNRLKNFGAGPQFAGLAVHHKTVIIASGRVGTACTAESRAKIRVDSLAGPEIKDSTPNRNQPAGGNEMIVNFNIG